jgi:Geranylgeranyl pyrophosphate synthase
MDLNERGLKSSFDPEVKKKVEEMLPAWMIEEEEEKRRLNQLTEEHSFSVIGSERAKRIRPQMGYKMLKGMGTDLSDEDIVQLFLSIEGIHNWSIILDDVEDDDDLRRGVPSVHKALEEETGDAELSRFSATNQSVIMNPRSYRPVRDLDSLSAEKRLEIFDILWKSVEKLGDGQNLDLGADSLADRPRKGMFNEDAAYLLSREGEEFAYPEFNEDVESLKTAALFEALGKISETVEEYGEDHLSNYGEKAGIAFQLRDDILDFTSGEGELGKDRYSDFAEGTFTLPIYFAVSYLDSHPNDVFSERADYLLDVLAEEDPEMEELEKAGEIVGYTPALAASENVCRRLVEEAAGYLDEVDWENEEYAEELMDLTVYGGLAREN